MEGEMRQIQGDMQALVEADLEAQQVLSFVTCRTPLIVHVGLAASVSSHLTPKLACTTALMPTCQVPACADVPHYNSTACFF